jgi:hypothetical protein
MDVKPYYKGCPYFKKAFKADRFYCNHENNTSTHGICSKKNCPLKDG